MRITTIKPINRGDKRYVILNDCDDEKAKEKGCIYRCWLNNADMGGWLDDNLEEFKEATMAELSYSCKEEAEESLDNCTFYKI